MTTTAASEGKGRPAPLPSPGARTAGAWVRWSWSVSPALTVLTMLAVVTLALSVAGYLVDERSLLGVSVWNKPAKFAISLLLWAPTLVAVYSLIDRGRLLRGALEILGWSMVLELALITMQAGRGVSSHFNYETTFDSAVFTAMAAGVGTMSVVAVVAGAILARARLGGTALGLAVKLAVPVMTAGAVLGFVMTSPREGQIESGDSTFGGHTIGASDGGPGLPLLGWSTGFGDLRVAHFLGLHALQALPLVALFLRRAVRRHQLLLSEREQRSIVACASAAYIGLVGITFWQALRGQSVTSPDQLTSAVAAAAVGLPLAVTIPILRRGQRLAGASTGPVAPDDLVS